MNQENKYLQANQRQILAETDQSEAAFWFVTIHKPVPGRGQSPGAGGARGGGIITCYQPESDPGSENVEPVFLVTHFLNKTEMMGTYICLTFLHSWYMGHENSNRYKFY